MTLRIDPSIPHVWRSPDRLQFGIDAPRVVLSRVSSAQERLIAALLRGTTREGLTMLAEAAGAAPREAARLVRTLAPVLLPEAAGGRMAADAAPARVEVRGSGDAARMIADLLGRLGFTLAADGRPDAAVLVDDFVTDPDAARHCLNNDIPHLCVVFGDTGARVGPFVRPGEGPCVRCLHLERSQADPAWTAIAVQAHGMSSPVHSRRLDSDVALVVAGALRVTGALRRGVPDAGEAAARAQPWPPVDATHSIRIDAADGTASVREHVRSPRCGCRALPGTATARDDRDGHPPRAPSSGGRRAVPA